MSFKSFIKKINKIANQDNLSKEDLKTGLIKNTTSIKGNILFNGILMNLNGDIIKNYKFQNLGILYKNFYLAQEKYEGSRWGLFDKKTDKKIWIKKEAIHHEILISPKETIFTFSKETKLYKNREVDFDTILEYNFNGDLLSTYSISENLIKVQKYHNKLELDFKPLPFFKEKKRRNSKSPWGGYYDYYRLNSMQIIPENKLSDTDNRFQQGNWLLSFRHGSLIFILDKNSKEIVYSLNQFSIKNQIQGQHSVQFLENGNILIFDNGRYREESRIIEVDPISLEIKFEYKNESFFSESQGYVQKINSKTYLITQSEAGKIFLIENKNNSWEITWEYINKELQNKNNSNYPNSYGYPQWIYRGLYYK